jgi:K+-transporting ATPase KdpF subunit
MAPILCAHAARYFHDAATRGVDHRQLRVRGCPEEVALMWGYIASGVVALLVTVYLFIALLFPERF